MPLKATRKHSLMDALSPFVRPPKKNGECAGGGLESDRCAPLRPPRHCAARRMCCACSKITNKYR